MGVRPAARRDLTLRLACADRQRVTLRPPFRVALAVVAGLVVVLLASPGPRATRPPAILAKPDGARYRLTEDAARRASAPVLPAPRPLQFGPMTAPADSEAVLAAVAAGRPEARRLIGLVAGITTITVGSVGHGIAGGARPLPGGRYEVRLDLSGVNARHGARGIARVTWHELAHVVDDALVTGVLERTLDAAVPRGWGCDQGGSGACASREERFAESFAKWATGDIGVDVYLGYRVPPPHSVGTWGAPLAELSRRVALP
jgi:hypothetical protein